MESAPARDEQLREYDTPIELTHPAADFAAGYYGRLNTLELFLPGRLASR